ncbi:MAG: hypothetical protein K0S07_798 [Chlamydiales bacterium]|jgi:hypothetical protein|nr:hypothetical protein [Chlamydiales bacterium]
MNLMAPNPLDINILHDYRFRSKAKEGEVRKIFGVYKDSKVEMLETIREDQLTLINRIKSWFGRGPLAHIKYSLKDVSLYLQKFDWEAISPDADLKEKRAYDVVCGIFGRESMQVARADTYRFFT